MKVIKIARVPSPGIDVKDTVLDAVRSMKRSGGGATAVLDGTKLVGIFSERDVMLRVVAAEQDPKETLVSQVMTEQLEKVSPETDSAEAFELMVSHRIRRLPIVQEDGKLVGLLSMRNLLQYHVEDLVDQLNSLEAYFAADGPGG